MRKYLNALYRAFLLVMPETAFNGSLSHHDFTPVILVDSQNPKDPTI